MHIRRIVFFTLDTRRNYFVNSAHQENFYQWCTSVEVFSAVHTRRNYLFKSAHQEGLFFVEVRARKSFFPQCTVFFICTHEETLFVYQCTSGEVIFFSVYTRRSSFLRVYTRRSSFLTVYTRRSSFLTVHTRRKLFIGVYGHKKIYWVYNQNFKKSVLRLLFRAFLN